MSDENETNNPYQAPTLTDEPLAKQDADGPKTRLNLVHWLVPVIGYAYVPILFMWGSLYNFANSFWDNSILETVNDTAIGLSLYIFFLLPIYLVVILFLGWRRHRQGTNTTGMKLYHGLSLILPTLWFAFIFWVAWSGAMV